MTEKRYIVDTDCLYSEVLDTEFGSNGVDKPTKQEIEDKDYFILCGMYTKSMADEVCERLNRYEEENKELKEDMYYWRILAQSLVKNNNKGGFE